jgi:hypothetical protein
MVLMAEVVVVLVAVAVELMTRVLGAAAEVA